MTDGTPALPEPKRRRVPPKIREAIDLLAQGRVKTVTAAAKTVGLSRERLSRALGEPHIAELVRQKAGRAVAMGALRAAAREVQLIDARSEHVSHDAAKHVLAIAGIRPSPDGASVNLNLSVRAGWILDLRPDARARLRTRDAIEPLGNIDIGGTACAPPTPIARG